ncbi:MAG TPA: hypothetical protein VGC82_19190, partial [Rhodopila sp.]
EPSLAVHGVPIPANLLANHAVFPPVSPQHAIVAGQLVEREIHPSSDLRLLAAGRSNNVSCCFCQPISILQHFIANEAPLARRYLASFLPASLFTRRQSSE